MNYEKIYYEIINKALRKELSGQRWKGDGNYYEKHHIKPRSLKGTDYNNNLVLLTAKEHYLCHWLLVKRYKIGTLERKKMLKAWFMMAGIGDTGRVKNSMKDYEKYRSELGKYMSIIQIGNNNSSYGSHWYTNYITGEYKKLKPPVSNEWILGKHFYGESMSLFANPNILKTHDICKSTKREKQIHSYKIKFYNIETMEMIYCKIDQVPEGYTRYKKDLLNIQRQNETKDWWDKFHRGNYTSFNEFSKELNITQPTLTERLKKYIPKYSDLVKRGITINSNSDYIGVYE